ncbi:hypothetical protein, partial [Aggregatibacter actinomycetemcomitans]|uniref:hypothetical protein n=1 Tax=Aggregatibacter actinomycetemcomitans TaxID=714 RepID=UPI00079C8F83
MINLIGVFFLSCLFGSEAMCFFRRLLDRFLSCLFGSEGLFYTVIFTVVFLSCLFGSEVTVKSGDVIVLFL